MGDYGPPPNGPYSEVDPTSCGTPPDHLSSSTSQESGYISIGTSTFGTDLNKTGVYSNSFAGNGPGPVPPHLQQYRHQASCGVLICAASAPGAALGVWGLWRGATTRDRAFPTTTWRTPASQVGPT